MKNRIMVVAAHMGDFVWRCGGAIATYAAEDADIKVIVLSDGIRGESNSYWKKPEAALEAGKLMRRNEGELAAKILGVNDFEMWDLSDYPMEISSEHVKLLTQRFREFHPDIILTHDTYDPFNPDHSLTNSFVRKAYVASTGAGICDGLTNTARRCAMFGFEPHETEVSHFVPGCYVDITDVFDTKCQAMKVFASQPSMYNQFVQRAEKRGSEVRMRGRDNCKYAEAFSSFQATAITGRFVW